MPTGIYTRTKAVSTETRKKLSECRRGEKNHFFGKSHTDEAKEKNRIAHTGKTGEHSYGWKGGYPKCVDCGKTLASRYAKRCHPCYCLSRLGYKHSAETKKKISEHHAGENAPNWQGGKSTEHEKIRKRAESLSWRAEVFSRDDYTCAKTGKRGGVLHAHHIRSFSDHPELRFDVANGVTLLAVAHMQFHKKYGQKNTTPEQLAEFLGKA